MEEKKQIEMNIKEAEALMRLIDAAVKATGLVNAELATYFANKINNAFKETEDATLTEND